MIIKVKVDVKKVESILEMVCLREKSLSCLNLKKFSTLIVETYCEIIKELSSALILLNGFKSVGENAHKDLVDFLANCKDFSEEEIFFIHDLRIKRNRSFYEGRMVDVFYLEVKQEKINEIIKKLKLLINNKLK